MYPATRIVLLVLAGIGLLAIVARSVWKRGKRVVLGTGAVDVNIRRGKYNSLHGAHVTIEIPGALRFSFQRERWFDRVAKSVGLSQEWQTGDHPFDGRVYILSDDPLVLEALSINGRMREVLLRLLATAGRALYCQDGRLWIVCAAEGESKETSDEELRRRFARKFGADLQLLGDSLTSVAGADLEGSRDLAATLRVWAARLSAACALAGLIGGIYSLYLDRQQVVHDVIVRWSNWIALCAAIASCAFVLIRLRGTSVAHRALMDILLAAVPGIWLAGNGALTWYNEHLDETRPATYGVRVVDVQRTRHKSTYVYHLVVENWPDPRGNRKVVIDERVSVFVRAGGCVDVTWRRGRLGDGWVAAYQQNDGGQCGGAFVE